MNAIYVSHVEPTELRHCDSDHDGESKPKAHILVTITSRGANIGLCKSCAQDFTSEVVTENSYGTDGKTFLRTEAVQARRRKR